MHGDTEEGVGPGALAPRVGSAAILPEDLALRVAPDGRIEWASVGEPRLGWTPEELIGRSVQDLMHPAALEDARAALAELLETGRNTRVVQVRTREGTYRWMSMRVALVRDADGRPVGSVGTAADVEDLVERIRLLEQSEHRYRLLAEGAADGVALGRDGVIQWVAGPTELLMGWTAAELTGREFLSLVHPDDHPTVARAIPNIDAGNSGAYEVRLLTKAGDYRWFAFRTDPVRDAHGAVVGRVTRWRVVDGVAPDAARGGGLADAMALGVDGERTVVLDLAGDATIRRVSSSVTAIAGYAPGELLGRSVLDLVVPEDRGRLMDAHARRSAAGISHVDEVRVLDARGNPRWVSATTVEITDDRGLPLGFVGLIHDVHDRVAARRELAVSEERLRLAMRSAPIGMAVLSLERRFRMVNPALARLLGRDEAWLLERGLADVLDPTDDVTDVAHCADLLSGRAAAISWDHPVTRGDGSIGWVEHSTALIRDPDGVPDEYVVQIVDVTETRRTHDQLRFDATHDPLTRVGNRRVLEARIAALLAHEPPGGGVLGALLLVDVDRLKEINDRYGHPAGDEVLVRVAERIGRQVRADDVVARFGGDEFAVVLPGMTTLTAATRVADKILGAMTEPVVCDGLPVVGTVSIGVALVRVGSSPAEVIQRTDDALYRAKRTGRGAAAAERGDP